jgi:hypothetical protein
MTDQKVCILVFNRFIHSINLNFDLLKWVEPKPY